MKKKLWKIWQMFLIISIPLSIISLIICGLTLDSNTPAPTIIGLVNLLWLIWLMICNDPSRINKKDRRNKKNEYKDKDNIAV